MKTRVAITREGGVGMKKNRLYNIPTTLQKVKMMVESGKMTITEAAYELCRTGFCNYVDEKYTREIINETKL